MENLLQAQYKQSLYLLTISMNLLQAHYKQSIACHESINLNREIEYLCYFQHPVPNYSQSGKDQGPFVVRRPVGDLDYEVKRTDG